MVNQMVTIHKARLKIVGLSKGKELKPDVDKSMQFILDYYLARLGKTHTLHPRGQCDVQ